MRRFQSTHPHGVRPSDAKYVLSVKQFQSTHPHGVRPSKHIPIGKPTFVSIHAPTRGATNEKLTDIYYIGGFNPRTHTGCDSLFSSLESLVNVSIHAPTRGATSFTAFANTSLMSVSIHAPTRGATAPCLLLALGPFRFQSTHPHGVRQQIQLNKTIYIYVSIHAPTRGATLYDLTKYKKIKVSIHAPTRGAT